MCVCGWVRLKAIDFSTSSLFLQAQQSGTETASTEGEDSDLFASDHEAKSEEHVSKSKAATSSTQGQPKQASPTTSASQQKTGTVKKARDSTGSSVSIEHLAS